MKHAAIVHCNLRRKSQGAAGSDHHLAVIDDEGQSAGDRIGGENHRAAAGFGDREAGR